MCRKNECTRVVLYVKNVINYWLIFSSFASICLFFSFSARGPLGLFSKVPTNKSNGVCGARDTQWSMMLLTEMDCHTACIWKVVFHVNMNINLSCMPIKKKTKWNGRCCFGMCLTRSIQFNNSVAVIVAFSSRFHDIQKKWWEIDILIRIS